MSIASDEIARAGRRGPGASSLGRRMSDAFDKIALKAALPLPAILYLLVVVTPVRFHAGPLLLTGLRLYLLILIIPLLWRLVSGRMGGIYLIDILFIAHLLWSAIALAVNNPDMVVTQFGSAGVEFLGGYLVGRAYIQTPEAFAGMCRWIVFLVVLTAPFAVMESLTGRPVIIEFIEKLPFFFSDGNTNNPPRLGLERAQVVFAHPIHYGLFCSVALSLCFVALKGQISDFRRFFLSAVVLVSGFLALSSGALLAIVLQVSLILWASLFSGVDWRWRLLVGLGAVAYVVVEILSDRSAIMVFLSYASFSAHNAYWRSIIFEWGMVNVWANPIFGIGMNDWVRPWYMYSGSMDNFWLVMAVRFGIPGFLLLAIGYSIGIFRIMRRDFGTDRALVNFRLAWVFTFLGLSFTLSTVHVWTQIYSFVFFLFGAGIWMIKTMPRSADSAEDTSQPDSAPVSPYTRFPKRSR